MIWPLARVRTPWWSKPKDELAPYTTLSEAAANAASAPKDGVDSEQVPRATAP